MLTTGLSSAGFEIYTFLFANNPSDIQTGIALLCTYPAFVFTLNGLEKVLQNIPYDNIGFKEELSVTLKLIFIIASIGLLIFNLENIVKIVEYLWDHLN